MKNQILDANINTPKTPEEELKALVANAGRVLELYEEYNSGKEEGESEEDYEAVGEQLRSDIDTLLNDLQVNQYRNDIMFLSRESDNVEFLTELRIVLLKEVLVTYYYSEEFDDIDLNPSEDRETVVAIVEATVPELIAMVEEDIETYTETGAHGLKNAMKAIKLKLDVLNQQGE